MGYFMQNDELSFRLGLNIAGANLSIVDNPDNPESGLDIDFDIDKTIDSTPNKSQITIWNVTPGVFNEISNKGTGIELYGGFGRDELALMFIGAVEKSSQVASKVNQTANTGFLRVDQGKNTSGKNDIPTIITCYDAGIEYSERLISRSYKGLVSSEFIIRDCVNQMGLTFGRMDKFEYPEIRDYVARGRCVNVLKEITARFGVKFNVANGVFNLVNPGQEPETTGIVLDGNNSNRPVLDKILKDGTKIWRIETELLPFFDAGLYTLCNFDTLKGTYRIYRVRSRGNNYGTQGLSYVYVK